jgi:hypothetical protein
LPDGPYVSKEWTRGVKIQFITGNLPLDNVIPFAVAEYFLRGISFRDNHPIVPGQEVTNRTVLTAAVVTPFLAAISPPESTEDTLPTYNYVGTQWPDFRIIVRDDRACTVYLAVMIALNATLLLGAAAFFHSLVKLKVGTALAATLLFVTSPYFIFQTIFTWPKELAAFFCSDGFDGVCNIQRQTNAGWLFSRPGLLIPPLRGSLFGWIRVVFI